MERPFTWVSKPFCLCLFSLYFPRQTWCIFPKSSFFVVKKKFVFSRELQVVPSVRLRTKNNLNLKVI